MAIIKALIVLVVALMAVTSAAQGGNFKDDFEPTFGDNRVRTYGQGNKVLSLSLDQTSGSGFRSKKEYLYGRVDMQIKLVPGNSAGTVTTFYLSSEGPAHDEIDFEFLGNSTNEPYTIHTNVFGQGKGDREQQFRLWFDPTKNFHTYSIVWNTKLIMFLVDGRTIRVYRNHEDIGVPFPKDQPMKIYASLWNADDWATQGGLVKTNWTNAPFTAFYRNFNIDACEGPTGSSCATAAPTTSIRLTGKSVTAVNTSGTWRTQDLDQSSRMRLRWVQKYFMVYNYCQDLKRFPQGIPPECKRSTV